MTNHPRLVASGGFFSRGGGIAPTPPTYPAPPASTLVKSAKNAAHKNAENAAQSHPAAVSACSKNIQRSRRHPPGKHTRRTGKPALGACTNFE